MDRLLMKKLKMVARVQEFHRAHPYTDRNQAAVGRRFEERLAEAQALFSREIEERTAYRAEMQQREALGRDLVATMRSVVRIGLSAVGDDPRLASRFKPVQARGSIAFVAQAKSLLEVANENQDVLLRAGLLRAQLAAFAGGLAEFQKVSAAIVVLRRKLNETRTALQGAMADLAKLVRVLDVFQTARFAGDASLFAAWRALRVVGSRATRGEGVEVATSDPAPSAAPGLPVAPDGGGNDPLPGDGGQSNAA